MNTSQSDAEFAHVSQRVWRRHSIEFKTRVIDQARQAHVSVAAVALANGLNANMLRRWLRESSTPDLAPTAKADTKLPTPQFVQLPASIARPAPTEPPSPSTVEVQIQRGQNRVVVSLPLGSSSAAWLREVLA